MTREEQRQKARDVAWSLGMPVYLHADGTITQREAMPPNPPGELIDPGPKSRSSPHGVVEPTKPPE